MTFEVSIYGWWINLLTGWGLSPPLAGQALGNTRLTKFNNTRINDLMAFIQLFIIHGLDTGYWKLYYKHSPLTSGFKIKA
jgi:hypothetical protein